MKATWIIALTATLALQAACQSAPQAPEARATAAPLEAIKTQWLALNPALADPPKPRQIDVLVDNPHLKVVIITLADGVDLPVHTAPVPVTIQALSGGGVADIGGVSHRLDGQNMVMLAAEAPHAVTPDPGQPLVLLVHYLRAGSTGQAQKVEDKHHDKHH